MQHSYDVIIIGSGQGGKPLAIEFAKEGKNTLLVEKDAIGGTCINRGCTPTKTLVASAKIANQVKRSKTYGVLSDFHSLDFTNVIRRKEKIVHSFRNSSEKTLRNTPHLDLVFADACFSSEKTVLVGEKPVSAPLIIINTGARPMIPSIEGIDITPYLDSTSIMELQELPKHLIIIGSSYVALEFGQMFRRFGSKVTILARSKQLITREDLDISESLTKILEKEGIDFLFETNIQKIGKGANNLFVDLETIKEKKQISGSHLLIATGRAPNSKDLHLENAKVSIDEKGFIQTSEKLQTTNPHIYAIGDVKGGPAFTHISYDDYRILRDNLLKGENRTIQGRMVPYVVFTDPQLGRIGFSEKDAKKANIPFKVAKIPMTYVARALEIDETEGFMKALVHEKTKEILGAAILGAEGGELMSMIQIAMMGKIPFQKLADGIFAHPTFAESLNTLFSNFK